MYVGAKIKDCCTICRAICIAGRSGCGDALRQPKNDFKGYKGVRDEARKKSNMLQRLEIHEVRSLILPGGNVKTHPG